MTTYEWTNIREKAIVGFGGQYPPGALESIIVEAFERDPVAVLGAVDRTAERYAQGKVNSPWHYLAKQAGQILEAAPATTATDTGSRERLVACADAWVRNAGVHYDRAEEVDAELFEDGGILRGFAEDELLRRRFAQLWAEQRPKGERSDAEHEERMRRVHDSPLSRSVPDWKPPKGVGGIVKPVTRGRDPGVGRCDDCRKDKQERITYGKFQICRSCAQRRDVQHGFSVPEAVKA
jgi:hypothetical protein